jgi:hypothetical protein
VVETVVVDLIDIDLVGGAERHVLKARPQRDVGRFVEDLGPELIEVGRTGDARGEGFWRSLVHRSRSGSCSLCGERRH